MAASKRRASRKSSRGSALNRSRRFNSAITDRVDQLSADIEKIKARKAERLGTPQSNSLLDAFNGMDIHSAVEKVANLTSRWERTIGLMGIIGSNIGSLTSPVLSRLNPLQSISSNLRSPSSSSFSTLGNESGNSKGQLDMNTLVETAQGLLSKLGQPEQTPSQQANDDVEP